MNTKLTVDFSKLPDVIWLVRKEFANVLRREAEAELDKYCADRLRAIAAKFEAGQ